MKNIIAILSIVLCTQLIAQNKPLFRETGTGLKVFFAKDVKGQTGKTGDLATIDMVMKGENGKEIKNTYKEGKPILFPIRLSVFEGDLYEAVGMLSPGDSALFQISADSMYYHIFKSPLPDGVKKGENLEFTIKLQKVRSQKAYKTEQDSVYNTSLKESDEVIAKRKKADDTKIKSHIATLPEKDLYIKTKSGLYYYVSNEGKGKKPVNTNTILLDFEGKIFKGQVFESSKNIGHPVAFRLGDGNVIPAWEELFLLLNEGSSVHLFVPSSLGYSNVPKPNIPANSILEFELKFISFH